jgi:hypothetical protein
MRIRAFTPILIQTALLAPLLLAAPFAMSFTAYERICSDVPIQADTLYGVRATFIIGGLIASTLSVAALIWELIKRFNEIIEPRMVRDLVLQASMAMRSVSVGWAAFPYWVNGVFQAYRGNGPDCTLNVYDPKDLMPMIWIGEVWRLGVLLILFVSFFLGLWLLLVSVVLLIKEREWRQCVPTLICLTITVAALFLQSGYGTWLAD